ncbi:cobalt-precorrin-6A reductase [Roseibium sp.]|uniref:cobalt-precorrin-6A reductase n=1 Tax=Roseibium sp. TaxID=1936156 RepID=UPI003A97C044
MTTDARILILGGTPEARQLALLLQARAPAPDQVILSFAGAVRDLPETSCEIRVGGFGGAEGLADYLLSRKITALVDATHPFAASISANAQAASSATGIPLLRLLRPAWAPMQGDDWTDCANSAAALEALPASCRPFLALGRQELRQIFSKAAHLPALFRSIEPADFPIPEGWRWIEGRPARSMTAELQLLRDAGITHMVTKNSGGDGAYQKIAAARALQIPVLMVSRPAEPAQAVLPDAEATCDALMAIFTTRS